MGQTKINQLVSSRCFVHRFGSNLIETETQAKLVNKKYEVERLSHGLLGFYEL